MFAAIASARSCASDFGPEVRARNFAIDLPAEWATASARPAGGELCVHASADEVDVALALPPAEDHWFCFRLDPRSWHSVTPVISPAGGERSSLVVTWAAAPGSGSPADG